jgi:hypothetical protein
MVNDRGFEVEVIDCAACGEQYYCSPNDPHDLCECPMCVEVQSCNLELQWELCDMIGIPSCVAFG